MSDTDSAQGTANMSTNAINNESNMAHLAITRKRNKNVLQQQEERTTRKQKLRCSSENYQFILWNAKLYKLNLRQKLYATNSLTNRYPYKHIYYHDTKNKTAKINNGNSNQSVRKDRAQIWVGYLQCTTPCDAHTGHRPRTLTWTTASNCSHRWPYFQYNSQRGDLPAATNSAEIYVGYTLT